MLLKPERVLLCAPSSIKLQAGIFDRLVRPPAIPASTGETGQSPKQSSVKMMYICKHCAVSRFLSPMIFAAVDAPTMMDRFGAMNDILDSTYS